MYKKIQVILILISLGITGAIGLFYMNNDKGIDGGSQEYVDVMINNEFHSAWLPYWDYSNAKLDWMSSLNKAKEIVSFGVLYQGEELYVPEATDEMTKELVAMGLDEVSVYLSFVNDVYQEDGTVVQKDVDFLKRFLPDANKRELYIEDIVSMAMEYGVDGIEIDFENMKKDIELWEMYSLFVEEMNTRCVLEGLDLRVVLSYDSAKYTSFPKGPQYIIMCYNLFGIHSDAGPKADKEFLEQTFEINEVLKPNVSMAFANNGFSWSDNGEVRAITKREAIGMANLYGVTVNRDESSACMAYDFQDAGGTSYEVWFADDNTLSTWKEWAELAGYTHHSLWRYGE